MSASVRCPAPWLLALGATVALALGLLLWIGRGTLYTVDDLTWFMTSPHLDLDRLLTPHNGHLILIPRLIFAGDLELFGSSYLPIRALTAAAAAASATLFFVWAARRVGRAVALAGTMLMLTLGTSYVFLIAGDGVMLQLSLGFGIGALLALERRDERGDLVACALLCAGVLTYSVALAFVVAAAVAVGLDRDRRRAWIPAVPVAIYGAWWLWSLGDASDSASQVDLGNLLSLPAYTFESLASVVGSLIGLNLDLSDAAAVRPEFDTTSVFAGPVVALAAIGLFAWALLGRRPVQRLVWVTLALPATLWLMGTLTEDAASPADATRFVLPFGVTLMMLAAATAGRPPSRGWTLAVWAIAACGIAANLTALRDGGDFRRDVDGPQLRAELAAFDLAGDTAVEDPDLLDVSPTGPVLFFPFSGTPVPDPATSYREAAARYGRLGFTPAELAVESEELRAHADATLLAARATALEPATKPPRACAPASPEFELPADGAVIVTDGAATVRLRRFADVTWHDLGRLATDEPAAIRIPPDDGLEPWMVQIDGAAAQICRP